MGQPPLKYLHDTQWVTEGSQWRPSTRPPTPDVITLRDEAGAVIGSTTMTTMILTLYDLMDPSHPIVGGIQGVDIKNTRSCSLSTQGVFVLTLLPVDTIILHPTRSYERRMAIVEYSWASGAKSDALEVQFVVRNLGHRSQTPISVMRVIDAAQVTLV
jgi:hypothetical protein